MRFPPRSRFARTSRLRLESLEDRTTPVAGALDLTFGGDGKATTSLGTDIDLANAVAVQLDGKIVVVGQRDTDFAVVRYNVDGSLDTSFDGDGKVFTDFGGIDVAIGVAIQADGKIVVAGRTNSPSNPTLLARYNADGSLDTSFDDDGKVSTSIGVAGNDWCKAVTIQSDGKILVAGDALNNFVDFGVARFNTDGSFDSTFDGDGKKTIAIGPGGDFVEGIAVQNDGKIVLAGRVNLLGGNADFALVRLHPNGNLDLSFNDDGKVTTQLGSNIESAMCVTIQPDGKIVAAGWAHIGPVIKTALVRYNADGSFDGSFGGGGYVLEMTGVTGSDAKAIVFQDDGKIVVAGDSDDINFQEGFGIARFNANGSLDTSFSGDGWDRTTFGTILNDPGGMAIYPGGKFVVVGTTASSSDVDIAITRYNADGSLDASFDDDADGRVTTPIGQGAFGTSIAIQPDGKIVVAGNSLIAHGANSDNDFTVARYSVDGSLDTSFGVDGIVTVDFGNTDQATGVVIDSNGRIVVVGTTFSSGGALYDFALARFTTNGSLDTNFDFDGKLATDFNLSSDYAESVAIDANGKIVVAGYTLNGGSYDFALARYNDDGSPDNSFDDDGKLTTNLGAPNEAAYAVALQTDGKIVAIGHSSDDFAAVRYEVDGDLDSSFDGDGVQTTAIGSTIDQAYAGAIQADGKIVLVGYSNNGSNYDFALVRYNSNGSLDATLDGDGKQTTGFGALNDYAHSVALQLDGKLVVGGFSHNGSNYDFAVARYNADGSLDTSFDGDGKKTNSIGNSNDIAYAVAVQTDGKIVAAGYTSNGIDDDFALIRLTGDNHVPVATPITFQATEDAPLRINATTQFSDPDGDLLTASLLVGPTHGTLTLSSLGAFVYSPDPDYVGPDSFFYKVTDPSNASDIGAVTINVVNDAADRLEVVTSAGTTQFTEGNSPLVVDGGLRIGSGLEGVMSMATVKFAAGYVKNKDKLTFTPIVGNPIKGTFNVVTGTLTLKGIASPAQYQEALRSVKFANVSPMPIDGIRRLSIWVQDAAGTGEAATKLLNVTSVNTKAIVTLPATALTYKTRYSKLAVASTLTIKDLDNTRLVSARVSLPVEISIVSYQLTVAPKAGITATFANNVLTLTGNATIATYQAMLRSLKFSASLPAIAVGPLPISIVVNDGLIESDVVTRTVNVI